LENEQSRREGKKKQSKIRPNPLSKGGRKKKKKKTNQRNHEKQVRKNEGGSARSPCALGPEVKRGGKETKGGRFLSSGAGLGEGEPRVGRAVHLWGRNLKKKNHGRAGKYNAKRGKRRG